MGLVQSTSRTCRRAVSIENEDARVLQVIQDVRGPRGARMAEPGHQERLSLIASFQASQGPLLTYSPTGLPQALPRWQ
eukprot:scaffold16_cov242-Pinguiococcus_pyrenoidosus.AAC.4